jgi:hypothetical protein
LRGLKSGGIDNAYFDSAQEAQLLVKMTASEIKTNSTNLVNVETNGQFAWNYCKYAKQKDNDDISPDLCVGLGHFQKRARSV